MVLRKNADTLLSIPDAYTGAQVFHMIRVISHV